MRRHLCFALLAATWLGCAQSRSRVLPEDGEDIRRYHRIGIPAFADKQGKGPQIADQLSAALQSKLYNDPIERAPLEKILSRFNLKNDSGLGVEALEEIHSKTSADAVVFGRMAPDWSSARVTVIETEMGSPVLRAVVMPKGRKKAFTTPEEIADEVALTFIRGR